MVTIGASGASDLPSCVTYATPTGEPCPRSVRADGSLEGSADCASCGCCLLLLWAAWPQPMGDTHVSQSP